LKHVIPAIAVAILYTVSEKKYNTKIMAIALSILNGFSKSFHCWREKLPTKPIYFSPYLQYVAALPCES